MLRSFMTACAAMAAFFTGATAAAQYATLYSWYSPSRGDHFTTSDPAWAGSVGDLRSPDYRMVRVEGSVLSPAYPQPADTVPVYSFWNPGRGDNFLTTNPAWVSTTDQDGYRRFRLEGYVYAQPKAGTRPLVSLWSASRADNFATTDPRLAINLNANAGNRTETASGGGYRTYRVEGYMLPPPSSSDTRQPDHVAALEKTGFGAWRPLMPYERGVRPEDPIARANARFKTKMVIVPLQFADVRFGPGDFVRFAKFASTTDDLSLERGVNALSRGRFAWQSTLTPVVQEPLTIARAGKINDALAAFYGWPGERADGTEFTWSREEFEDQHGFSIDVYDLDGDGVEDDELNARSRVLKLADRFIRFNTFDTNNDERIDSSELIVLRFGADPGIGGQMGWSGAVTADGKAVGIPVGLVAKDTTRAGLMHEMLHVWGGTDVYGPGYALNFRNTIMAGMAGEDSVWELDPWHQSKFGWVRPRFAPIGQTASLGGGAELMLAAGHDVGGQEAARPIVFFDPRRTLNEYFVVQYRTPNPQCPGSGFLTNLCPNYQDNGAPDTGFAVWHVVTKADGSLQDIRKSDATADRVAWPSGTPDDGHMFRLGTIDPSDGKIGATKYLSTRDGELALKWWSGEDTGIRLKAGLVSRTSPVAVLQWRDVTRSFTPRLDILRVAGFPAEEYPTVNAGQRIAVDGVFGATGTDFGARLIPESGGAERPATVYSWAPTRALIDIPPATPPGRYKLAVGPRAAAPGAAWLSNGLKLQIPASPLPRIDLPRDFDRRISAPELRAPQLDNIQIDLSERPVERIAPLPGSPINPHGYDLQVRPELQLKTTLPPQVLELPKGGLELRKPSTEKPEEKKVEEQEKKKETKKK